jgi:hypothetical protein
MTCEHVADCAFLVRKGATVPLVVEMMKRRYCAHDKEKCARYGLAQQLGLEAVPDTLWPNDGATARKIAETASQGARKDAVPDLSDKCLLEFHDRWA